MVYDHVTVHTNTVDITVPAFLIGIVLGPLAAKFIDATRWGSAAPYQKEEITLVCPENPSSVLVGRLTNARDLRGLLLGSS